MNVVNLWVEREARKREALERALVWVCACGSTKFNYYINVGLVCASCETRIPQKGK